MLTVDREDDKKSRQLKRDESQGKLQGAAKGMMEKAGPLAV